MLVQLSPLLHFLAVTQAKPTLMTMWSKGNKVNWGSFSKDLENSRHGYLGEWAVAMLLAIAGTPFKYDWRTHDSTGAPFDLVVWDKTFDVKTIPPGPNKVRAMVPISVVGKKGCDFFWFVRILEGEDEAVIYRPVPFDEVAAWPVWDDPRLNEPAHVKHWLRLDDYDVRNYRPAAAVHGDSLC